MTIPPVKPPSPPSPDKASRRKRFESVFAIIRDELLAHFASERMPKDAIDWYRRVSGFIVRTTETTVERDYIGSLHYYLPGCNLKRGMYVDGSVEILKGEVLRQDEYFKVSLLGWCFGLVTIFLIPFLNAFFPRQ